MPARAHINDNNEELPDLSRKRRCAKEHRKRAQRLYSPLHVRTLHPPSVVQHVSKCAGVVPGRTSESRLRDRGRACDHACEHRCTTRTQGDDSQGCGAFDIMRSSCPCRQAPHRFPSPQVARASNAVTHLGAAAMVAAYIGADKRLFTPRWDVRGLCVHTTCGM